MAQTYSHLFPGVPLALGSAILFGATPPLSKLLLGVVHAFMLAGLLYLEAGIGLAVYCFLRATTANAKEARIGRKDVPWLALIGTGTSRCGTRIHTISICITDITTANVPCA
jgi:hypothetical protein